MLVVSVALTCFGQTAWSGIREEVKFKRGASSAEIDGGVVRGERDKYLLGAAKGQYLSVSISSLEDNAVFSVYPTGAKELADDEMAGKPISSASEVKAVTLQLPESGKYLILVGGTRGNANYKLSVAVGNSPPATVSASKQPAEQHREAGQVSILGGWVCSVTWESGPSVRPYAFFDDSTFLVIGDAGNGQKAFVSGTYQQSGAKLEITESISRVVDRSGNEVLGWTRNAKGNDLSRTNYKIHEYRFAQKDRFNFTMNRLRTSTGTGVSRDAAEKDQKAVNCVRSTEAFVDLQRMRRAIPDLLFVESSQSKQTAEREVGALGTTIQRVAASGRTCHVLAAANRAFEGALNLMAQAEDWERKRNPVADTYFSNAVVQARAGQNMLRGCQ